MDNNYSSLSPYQKLLIQRLMRSFTTKVETWVNPDSDIVTDDFESVFRSRLLFHHTITDEVLIKKSFEYAFRDASTHAGRVAAINRSSTARSYDVLVDEVRYSLKTEASSSISQKFIHISKFMECAWLRYVEGSRETLVQRIEEYIGSHLREYDRVLILRIFRSRDWKSVKYILVEIPKAILDEIMNLQPGDFEPINARHSTSAKVNYLGRSAFTLRFDGSDEKVTIANLQVDQCKIHASWIIPVLFTEEVNHNSDQMES